MDTYRQLKDDVKLLYNHLYLSGTSTSSLKTPPSYGVSTAPTSLTSQ